MTKLFCDKCGKEIKFFDPFYKIKFTRMRNDLKSHTYYCEMCIECYEKFVDWLETSPDAQN